jgi:hypothetical protein
MLKDYMKVHVKEVGWGGVWIGAVWLRIEYSGGLL